MNELRTERQKERLNSKTFPAAIRDAVDVSGEKYGQLSEEVKTRPGVSLGFNPLRERVRARDDLGRETSAAAAAPMVNLSGNRTFAEIGGKKCRDGQLSFV